MESAEDGRELLVVKSYCFDMLAQLADLLQHQGGEPELADALRNLLATRHGQPAEVRDPSSRGEVVRIAPEPPSFA